MSQKLLALLVLLAPANAMAELSVPSFFSDHMVLQRDCEASLWGKTDPGGAVTVTFKNATNTVKADQHGHWRAAIATGSADENGTTLKIAGSDRTIEIKDVLVGEVWFASGQSNMVFTMDRVPDYQAVMEEAKFDGIRMFNAPLVTAIEPQDDIAGQWTACQPDTIPQFSAVAFFFARKLHRELKVPIGVIKSAWGGKPVETFTSRTALRTLPGTKVLVEAAVTADSNFDPQRAQKQYEERLQSWKAANEAWQRKPAAERGRRPRRPQPPKRALDTEGQPGVLFNSMINPFVGYTIRGAIWYQGEGNAKPGAVPYDQTLPLLIRDWRQRWQSDFSFYFVQLANFRDPVAEPGNNDPWPLLQDRMRRVLNTTPRTGMAIINDIGEAKDIHPKNKHDVGERLALWALANDYGQKIVYSGPLYRSHSVEDNAVRVSFDHVGAGLKSRDGGALQRFEVAGEDQVWHWADATIIGKAVVQVSSKEVKRPVAVRYAWAANPEGANLVNSEGLPASVFRTDAWDDVEASVDTAATQRQQRRRELAVEIKALAAQRSALQRGTEEFRVATEKHRRLLEEFRSLAP
ncbi:MAG: sialate O-acetylesterase [Planctomycetales bacterium]|nr:sialate O-acetylesterase [Planctomycetales bacterium]